MREKKSKITVRTGRFVHRTGLSITVRVKSLLPNGLLGEYLPCSSSDTYELENEIMVICLLEGERYGEILLKKGSNLVVIEHEKFGEIARGNAEIQELLGDAGKIVSIRNYQSKNPSCLG